MYVYESIKKIAVYCTAIVVNVLRILGLQAYIHHHGRKANFHSPLN